MVKGVNKMIVEVANSENEFFERAIFFVRPQMRDISPRELRESADVFFTENAPRAVQSSAAHSGAADCSAKKRRRRGGKRASSFSWFGAVMLSLGIAGIAAVIATVLLFIIF
ncbi:MAG: hypothetical protein FWD35_02435 [Oscillospiraceae bacterium]|nr:hypothetical protein [Oscillospiraceae bacterium]